MVMYSYMVVGIKWKFKDLVDFMVKVIFLCFGDELVGFVVYFGVECVVVQMVLVEMFFEFFLEEYFIFYEEDEVIRFIVDDYD